MSKDYLDSTSGCKKKYKRESLLNFATNKWRLNQNHSIDKTSALIRNCSPDSYEEWVDYYFNNAYQQKKNGLKITREYLNELGKGIYKSVPLE